MHLEVVQALRCPADHAPTWLVARTDLLDARHIAEGMLGCPACGAEYPVTGGVLRLGTALPASYAAFDGDAPLRAAALLDLTTPHGLVLLAGDWARIAVDVAAMVDEIHLVALDSPADAPPPGLGVSAVEAGACIPLRASVARGIALDQAHATAGAMKEAVEALRPGGRLIAPVAVPLPSVLVELARDARWWVAERPVEAPVVSLTTSRRPHGQL